MRSYVSAIESSPPPAPASACATLSLCWAAVLCGTEDTDSASFCCAFSWACDMVVLCGRARVLMAGQSMEERQVRWWRRRGFVIQRR